MRTGRIFSWTSESQPVRDPVRCHCSSHRRRQYRDSVRDLDAADRSGRFPGLLSGRHHLPDHARPVRERRSVERRPGGLARPARPLKPRYYHGGDFQGIINRLPYLKSLGVTALWINPWYDNNNGLNRKEIYDGQPITDYHGYGAIDFYGVEEHFGDLATLRELVEAAHRLGMKVIQDQVANHTGPYHPWVTDSPTPTWYNGTADRHLANTWQTGRSPIRTHPSRCAGQRSRAGSSTSCPISTRAIRRRRATSFRTPCGGSGVTGLDGIRQDTCPTCREPSGATGWRPSNASTRACAWSARCSMAIRRWCRSSPAAGRQYDGIDTRRRFAVRLPDVLPIRQAFAQGKPMRNVSHVLSNDRLYPHPR